MTQWSSGDAEQEAGDVTELYKEHEIHKWNLNINDSNYVWDSGTGLAIYGDVSGSGSITGTSIFGNVDIGNSPGEITLEDVTMSPSSTTTFEVAGIDPSQFDRLIVVGSVALNGTAKITFDNFTPDQLDTFQLIDLTNGTASSSFSSVVAPEGWTLSTDGLLVIPEPATLPLLALGMLMAWRRR